VKKTDTQCRHGLRVRRGYYKKQRSARTLPVERGLLEGGGIPMKRSLAPCLVCLVLVLAACGYRQDGESCWSDDMCVSGYCSWGGTCSSGLLELIADLLREAPKPPPPSPAPPPPPSLVPQPRISPLCPFMDEKECRATSPCRWVARCSSDLTAQDTDAGMPACEREHFATGSCPSGCLLTGLCA
jgi:hypothetical protein